MPFKGWAACPKRCVGHVDRIAAARMRQGRIGSAAQATRSAQVAVRPQGWLRRSLCRPRRSNRIGHKQVGSAGQASQIAHVAFQKPRRLLDVLRGPHGSDYGRLRAGSAAQTTQIGPLAFRTLGLLPENLRRLHHGPWRPLTAANDLPKVLRRPRGSSAWSSHPTRACRKCCAGHADRARRFSTAKALARRSAQATRIGLRPLTPAYSH